MRPHLAVAEALRQQILNLAHLRLLKGRAHIVGTGTTSGTTIRRRARQQIAVFVHDRDLIRLQLRHGGGDEMLDRRDLFTGQHRAIARLDKDARSRRLRAVAEQFALRQHQMHPRILHGIQRADCTR